MPAEVKENDMKKCPSCGQVVPASSLTYIPNTHLLVCSQCAMMVKAGVIDPKMIVPK